MDVDLYISTLDVCVNCIASLSYALYEWLNVLSSIIQVYFDEALQPAFLNRKARSDSWTGFYWDRRV